MAWDFDPDKPLYLQIVENIKLKIINGEYPPGARLASVRELAAEKSIQTLCKEHYQKWKEKIYFIQKGHQDVL